MAPLRCAGSSRRFTHVFGSFSSEHPASVVAATTTGAATRAVLVTTLDKKLHSGSANAVRSMFMRALRPLDAVRADERRPRGPTTGDPRSSRADGSRQE